ncbi:hypothetical protein AGDE_13439 [Angomonas deanei]|uniref:Uncharacterized protein n=1 Tax=Angomonas deanei TaxID=59799 RepID=A0A7G2CB44_9TRYP|nr:hypothetical protein AGDE_13439 [Angomonas deanei]CAD2216301.1 hypothetical protein, conserved [Angomonas deanei]|eukprot:EPY22382.1 hypothetical protein AGDE_13439 [Angomonas deanei]
MVPAPQEFNSRLLCLIVTCTTFLFSSLFFFLLVYVCQKGLTRMPRVIVQKINEASSPLPVFSLYEHYPTQFNAVKKSKVQTEKVIPKVEKVATYKRSIPRYVEPELLPECDETVEELVLSQKDTIVNQHFKSSLVMPPPPPTHDESGMQFWYDRLVLYPMYNTCCSMCGWSCPAPVECQDVLSWTEGCLQWWSELRMRLEVTHYKVPNVHRWNPYDANTARVVSCALLPETNAACSSSPSVPLSAPPSYELTVPLLSATLGPQKAEKMFLEAMDAWWMRACVASASLVHSNKTVCPPPQAVSSLKQWSNVCAAWFNLVTIATKGQITKSKRHTPLY